jgi:hypothetical protein
MARSSHATWLTVADIVARGVRQRCAGTRDPQRPPTHRHVCVRACQTGPLLVPQAFDSCTIVTVNGLGAYLDFLLAWERNVHRTVPHYMP